MIADYSSPAGPNVCALPGLAQVSLGLPRALNNAANAALIAAATVGKALANDECAKRAAAEITRD
jgi:type II secretory pathway predicted ATPase ExeA